MYRERERSLYSMMSYYVMPARLKWILAHTIDPSTVLVAVVVVVVVVVVIVIVVVVVVAVVVVVVVVVVL